MEIEGKIKMIDVTKEVGTGGFKKRDVVITSDEQYPQHILVQFVQDKCDILDNYKVGESVVVGINLRGREWTNPQGEVVYFNQIQGWKINRPDTSKQTPPANDAKTPTNPKQAVGDDYGEDTLPF
jgi:hypothetical protein